MDWSRVAINSELEISIEEGLDQDGDCRDGKEVMDRRSQMLKVT